MPSFFIYICTYTITTQKSHEHSSTIAISIHKMRKKKTQKTPPPPKNKHLERLKISAFFILIILMSIGVIDHLSRTVFSPLKVENKAYRCSTTGCDFNISVSNTDPITVSGYANILAYERVHHGDAVTYKLIARQRATFTVNSGESKDIEGFIKTPIHPSKVEMIVGER